MNPMFRDTPEMINRPTAPASERGDLGFKVALVLFTCLFMAWFMFAADMAGAAAYKGKTKGGSTVTFKLAGKKASKIRTVVPTICVETTGGYASRAGGELFQPVEPGRIGKTVKSKALQPAALNQGIEATKNYEVTLKQKGRRVTGTLKLNFSFLIPDLWTGAKIFICSGSTTFSANPR